MPLRRILHVPDLLKLIWDKWPEHGANQFMAQAEDRLRLELQTRTLEERGYPHVHLTADTVHIIIEGEGEYSISPGVWVPVKAGDVIYSRSGEVHGGRGIKTGEPLRYLVIEGPAPEDFCSIDGDPVIRKGEARVKGPIPIAPNGGIIGTNVLLGGPNYEPEWVAQLNPASYRDS